jgi:hypothetical protein
VTVKNEAQAHLLPDRPTSAKPCALHRHMQGALGRLLWGGRSSLGSNIFNTLLVVGVAALFSPITITRSEIQVGVVASIVVVALAIPGRSARLGRWRSVPLLATYLVVITLISSGWCH